MNISESEKEKLFRIMIKNYFEIIVVFMATIILEVVCASFIYNLHRWIASILYVASFIESFYLFVLMHDIVSIFFPKDEKEQEQKLTIEEIKKEPS